MSFNPYDDTYLNRIGERKKAINEEKNERFKLDPDLHHHIAVVIGALAKSSTMTMRQYDTLLEPVRIADGQGNITTYPSPSVTWEHEPDYQTYLRALPAILTELGKRVTISNLIAHARGYHWKRIGYFDWKEQYGTKSIDVTVVNDPGTDLFGY